MQRDKEKEEEEETNRKIRVKGKCVFYCMCFFNGVCREIEGVQIEFLFYMLNHTIYPKHH